MALDGPNWIMEKMHWTMGAPLSVQVIRTIYGELIEIPNMLDISCAIGMFSFKIGCITQWVVFFYGIQWLLPIYLFLSLKWSFADC